LPLAISCAQPGGRNFVGTKLRGLPPSMQRSGMHVFITSGCRHHDFNKLSRLQIYHQARSEERSTVYAIHFYNANTQRETRKIFRNSL
jgi:hypothetical protein